MAQFLSCMRNLKLLIAVLALSAVSLPQFAQQNVVVKDTVSDQNASTFKQDLPTFSITDSDAENGLESQTINGLLSSSSDIFVSTAAYTFGPARFRIKGYDQKYTSVMINGFIVNDVESGGPYWSNWGGLNDVMRNNVVTNNSAPEGTIFEPIGGISRVITDASSYRKGVKAVYSMSNRTYRNRLMLTYSTGMLENNWAFTGSVSRRWSQEGFVPGTFYDANSFFLSAEKIINSRHTLNFTALDALYKRGVGGGSVQEVYDLTGSNYYNPYWGFQDGGKRNSRVRSSNKPLLTLKHTWKAGENTSVKTTAGTWFGRGGYTALNWHDAPDPRPDYWRNLPSYYTLEEDQQRIAAGWSDPSVSQLNWDHFYSTNRKNLYTTEDVDGVAGKTYTGYRSKYIIEDRRNDISQFQVNTTISHKTGNLNISGGLSADIYQGHNFNVIEDLLGGEYWLDIDQFAERDFPDDPDAIQNDLNNPNRIVKEGDTYSHNYTAHQNKFMGWGLLEYDLNRFYGYLGTSLASTSIWREGHTRKGLFPENSFGDSKHLNFTTFGIKAGTELRLSGRHILQFNFMHQGLPPTFRNAFLSPRTRNTATPGLTAEKILSADASYIARLPWVTGRLTAYYTKFSDQTELSSFYHDELRTFVNYSVTGIDKEHYGIEYGAEFKLTSTLTLNTVAAIGQYLWVSNPDILITQDNNSEILSNDEVWVQYFRLNGTPQTALAAGIEYSSPNYWWAGITGSFYDHIYIDFNPVSRTRDESGYYPNWTEMEKQDNAFLIDAFIGKSWALDDMFITLSANLSNITNTTDFVTGGFEQYRFDPSYPDRFQPKYYYYYGFNYFINFSIRM